MNCSKTLCFGAIFLYICVVRKRKWTYEKCKEEALNYSHRYQFQLNSNAYSAAARNGWLDEICAHMKKTGNWYKRCVYVYEFSDNSVYVGLTYNLDKRKLNRLKNKNDAVVKHISKTNIQPIIKQITDYIDVNEASKLEVYYIEKYSNDGWVVLNVGRGGTVGNNPYKWDYVTCKETAKNFRTRNEFKKAYRSAYESARTRGWLDDICSHMVNVLNHWTFENCKNEAMKYRNRTELHDNANGAYNVARKNGWLDKFFK